MKALACLYFWIAQQRRSKGLYDATTLDYFKRACELSSKVAFHLAYARLQRDIHGYVDHNTLDIVQQAALLQVPDTTISNRLKLTLSEFDYPNKYVVKRPASQINDQNIKALELDAINSSQLTWRQELFKYLHGRSIAVVGNGTSLANTNMGQSIDSNTIVCRFNRFPSIGDVSNDVGHRTDIWITSPDVLNEKKVLPNTLKWVIISGGDVRYTLQNWSGAINHLKQDRRIITIPLEVWSSLVKQLQAPPSAGILWLHYLSTHQHLDINIHAYGFDKTDTNHQHYHIGSKSFKPSSRHAWTKEKAYLATLTQGDKVTSHHGITLGAFSPGLAKNQYLKRHLSCNKVILNPQNNMKADIDLIIGWGRKANTQPAIEYAALNSLAYASLEDGFIHSMSQGRLGASSWSLVIDKSGLFYDATQTSDLEQLINTSSLNEQQYSRARACLKLITDHHITKYNNAKLRLPESLKQYRFPVLVIDQVDGDTSIPYALASKTQFENMLAAAIAENPDADILIKIHPDVMAGKRQGCLTLGRPLPPNVHLLADNINPLVLMKQVAKVYVVSSQTGFEALLLGKPVVCFGAPFYAGWGLTDDRLSPDLPVFNRRKARPDLLTLFHATHIQYSRYLDPLLHRPCELETVLSYVKLQYQQYQQNTGKLFCLGFPLWKKRFIPYYLKSLDNEIHFINNESQAQTLGCDSNSKVLTWSSKHEATAKQIIAKTGAKLMKIEDGFLRSINLGSNYAPPASLVFDSRGIYFDPSQPSDLEDILQNHLFEATLLSRARKLRDQITTLEISKYNVGTNQPENLFNSPAGKKIILIPGQVADDASIKLGCRDIKDNLSLIKMVRQRNPNAYIAYKPHPDVVSKNRHGALSRESIETYCDQIIENTSITDCLKQVDEVHTLTSLVGFEALMRGLMVHCYGLPFYAGWGLTEDEYVISRRNRQLSLDALVAGVLIVYPRYFDWASHSFTTAENLASELHRKKMAHMTPKVVQNNASIQKAKLLINLLKAVISPSLK